MQICNVISTCVQCVCMHTDPVSGLFHTAHKSSTARAEVTATSDSVNKLK